MIVSYNNKQKRCLASVKLASEKQNATAWYVRSVMHGKEMFCASLCFDNHHCVTSTTSQSFR